MGKNRPPSRIGCLNQWGFEERDEDHQRHRCFRLILRPFARARPFRKAAASDACIFPRGKSVW
jgi:hypothetical protein